MGCTVAELLERLSEKELNEWQLYYKLEPFGARVNNFNAGQVLAMLQNIYRKEGAKAMTAEDFALGDFDRAEQGPQSMADMIAVFKPMIKDKGAK